MSLFGVHPWEMGVSFSKTTTYKIIISIESQRILSGESIADILWALQEVASDYNEIWVKTVRSKVLYCIDDWETVLISWYHS